MDVASEHDVRRRMTVFEHHVRWADVNSIEPVSWSCWKRVVWPVCLTEGRAHMFSRQLAIKIEEENN
jgi:hypothetical protein